MIIFFYLERLQITKNIKINLQVCKIVVSLHHETIKYKHNENDNQKKQQQSNFLP